MTRSYCKDTCFHQERAFDWSRNVDEITWIIDAYAGVY